MGIGNCDHKIRGTARTHQVESLLARHRDDPRVRIRETDARREGWDEVHAQVKLYFVVDEHLLPILGDSTTTPSGALPNALAGVCGLLLRVERSGEPGNARLLNDGWQRLAEDWRGQTVRSVTNHSQQTVAVVEAVVLSGADMTVAEYRISKEVDLDHLPEPEASSPTAA